MGKERFYVFTELVRQPAAGASGGWTFGFYVFTKLVLFVTAGPFGDKLFRFNVFTDLVLLNTAGPFGDPLSGLPERGERATKGLQSRPLETCFDTGERRGDVRRSYEFAQVQLTRFRPVRWRAVGIAFYASQKRLPPFCNRQVDCKHCFHRTQLYCSNCGENVGT